jgi:hypothetical protein
MADRVVVPLAGRPVVLVDSVSYLTAADRGAAVVSGSHGGTSAAGYALTVLPAVVAFNDAGGGKDGAGFRALALLDPYGVAALTVSHDSARIGDAADAWRSGVVSRVNAVAAAKGAEPGLSLRAAFARLLSGRGGPAGRGRG